MKVKLFFKFLFALLPVLNFLLLTPSNAMAAATCSLVGSGNKIVQGYPDTFTVSGYGFNPADSYKAYLVKPRSPDLEIKTPITITSDNKLQFRIGGTGKETDVGANTIKFVKQSQPQEEVCRATYRVLDRTAGCTIVRQPKEPGVAQTVTLTFGNIAPDTPLYGTGGRGGLVNRATISPSGPTVSAPSIQGNSGQNDTAQVTVSGFKSQGTYEVTLGSTEASRSVICKTSFTVFASPGDGGAHTVTDADRDRGATSDPSKPEWCGTNSTGLKTAVGCVPVGDTNEFVGWFLKWALGIAGGVAFMLMLMAGIQIMSSTGNPDKIQGGKELLNAAISGLVLIIFSVFLLKLIGVDILALPGFGN